MTVSLGLPALAWASDPPPRGDADGRREPRIGGRIDLDAVAYHDDVVQDNQGGAFVRRAYLNFDGWLRGWHYRFGTDFASAVSPTAVREIWIARPLAGGELTVGQRKPFRGLEEITYSDDTLMMERPFTSTNGIYSSLCQTAACSSTASRQYLPGVFYSFFYRLGLVSVSVYSLHPAGEFANEGVGANLRAVVVPVSEDDLTVHVGVSGTFDDPQDVNVLRARVSYAGRDTTGQAEGPSRVLAITGPGAAQRTAAAELAAAVGWFFLQAEFAQARFDSAGGPGIHETVRSGYAQASVFLTGESRPYADDRGAFRSPRPARAWGALELAARYDRIENPDRAPAIGPGACAGTVLAPAPTCEVRAGTLGLNYYVSPEIRLMFNHVQGEDRVNGDRTSSDSLRMQLSF